MRRRPDPTNAGADLYGVPVTVGCVVAYNYGGAVALGEVIRVTPSRTIWIDRKPTYYDSTGKGGTSKVKNSTSVLVLKSARL